MSTHNLTFIATLPQGDPDIGAEIDLRITVDYCPAVRSPGWSLNPTNPDRITFVSAEPVLRPFYGAFADLEQAWLDDFVSEWLESDAGYDAVIECFHQEVA